MKKTAHTLTLLGFLVFLLYPEIFLMRRSPMLPTGAALHDSIVSSLTFFPGLETLRHEIFENGQILWSSLRSMGMPLLGNEIQIAPLFPLTLLFLWVPGLYFWNVFVIARLLSIVFLSFFVARDVLGLRRSTSTVFALAFGCSVYTLRFLNHPWQNGLLAGLLYLYSTQRILVSHSLRACSLWAIANALGVYSMITSGFPEASVLSALLFVFVMAPQLIVFIKKNSWGAARRVMLFVALSHVAGFCLASIQLTSLVEFVTLAQHGFRAPYGQKQFSSLAEFFLPNITPLSKTPPTINFYFGFVGGTLFILGLVSIFVRRKRLGTADASALCLIVFFLLKLFPLWPAFNSFVGSLPLLKTCWFHNYFISLLVFPFAYYSARGTQLLLSTSRQPHAFRSRLFVRTALFASLGLLFIGAEIASQNQLNQSYFLNLNALTIRFLFIALAFVALYWLSQLKKTFTRSLPVCISILLFIELLCSRAGGFVLISDAKQKYLQSPTSSLLKDPLNVRLKDFAHEDTPWIRNRLLISDNGASAILQNRLHLFRTGLFNVSGGGYMPLGWHKHSVGWPMTSTSYFIPHDITINLPIAGHFSDGRPLFYDERALPRAYIASTCFFVNNAEESLRLLTREGFALGSAILENLRPEDVSWCTTYARAREPVSVIEDRGRSLRLNRFRGPAVLMLHDNFYPGWIARDTATGEQLTVLPGNLTFRSLILREERSYDIEFRYEPEWLHFIRSLTLLGGLLLMFFAVLACGPEFRKFGGSQRHRQ